MASIRLIDLRKSFEGTEAVCGISLDIADTEFVVLVGPSGCGKSTTLRMIAGLDDVTSGEVHIGNAWVNDVPPKDRDIAMVFQNYALYPHMSVFENMAFGLRRRRMARHEIDQRVHEAAETLGIEELLDRLPKQLSGGQRQRVAMGRAIVRHPKAFLFDEPLSNLDAKLRVQMRTEIKKLHLRLRTTIVYVTHDQVEAMTLADRIVVMRNGLIEQVGTPQEMYDLPATRFVAGFIGSPAMNFIPCRVITDGRQLSLDLGGGQVLPVPEARKDRYGPHVDRSMLFGIRPEHFTEQKPRTNQLQVDVSAEVDVLEPLGMDTMVSLKINGSDVRARCSPSSVGRVGEPMTFTVEMNNMHLIDPSTDRVV